MAKVFSCLWSLHKICCTALSLHLCVYGFASENTIKSEDILKYQVFNEMKKNFSIFAKAFHTATLWYSSFGLYKWMYLRLLYIRLQLRNQK